MIGFQNPPLATDISMKRKREERNRVLGYDLWLMRTLVKVVSFCLLAYMQKYTHTHTHVHTQMTVHTEPAR